MCKRSKRAMDKMRELVVGNRRKREKVKERERK